ncbi:MAG: hypothetical protein ACE15B_08490 [Bryobacteraceae bacterium]
MAVPNRLAREQEDLIAHRFPTGSMGMASGEDVRRSLEREPAVGLWEALKAVFNPAPSKQVAAVCIPPGARLMLYDIPRRLQNDLGVEAQEEVTFTQISAQVSSYRDAVRFRNGRILRLQELREGQRVKVLDLSSGEPSAFEPRADRELMRQW